MKTRWDGGPAFPGERTLDREVFRELKATEGTHRARLLATFSAPGMSLRDYLAGQALAGMLAHPHPDHHGEEGPAALAVDVWAAVDALLASRAPGAGSEEEPLPGPSAPEGEERIFKRRKRPEQAPGPPEQPFTLVWGKEASEANRRAWASGASNHEATLRALPHVKATVTWEVRDRLAREIEDAQDYRRPSLITAERILMDVLGIGVVPGRTEG